MLFQDAYQAYLTAVLLAQLPERGQAWLRAHLTSPAPEQDVVLTFSLAPRFVGKEPLAFTAAQRHQAQELRPGFDPSNWTTAQAARTLLLLRAAHLEEAAYSELLNQLFGTADAGEQAHLYASLPLLPYPEAHTKRAAEGVRTAMTNVFDAIALGNPYPHDYLPQGAWNQLILKAVFNARPLYRIYGLDNRRNEPLARMLLDYAHERWAAGRTLTPEVWRLVGPYLTADSLPDAHRLLHSPNPLEVRAGTLALAACGLPEARFLLAQVANAAEAKPGSWQLIGEQAYAA